MSTDPPDPLESTTPDSPPDPERIISLPVPLASNEADWQRLWAERRDRKPGEDGELTETELAVVIAAQKGFVIESNELAHQDKPLIRAGVIEFLCIDPVAKRSVSRRGIRIRGFTIQGDLDLSHAVVPWTLGLVNCEFIRTGWQETSSEKKAKRTTVSEDSKWANLNFDSARIFLLNLSGSHGGKINAERLQTDNDCFLRYGFKAEGTINLQSAKIEGRLDFNGAKLKGKDAALNAHALETTNLCRFGGLEAEGTIILMGAKIGGQLDFCGAKLKGKEVALNAQALEAAGGCFLRDGFEAEGTINLMGAKISLQLDFTGAKLKGREVALAAQELETTSNCFLRDGFEAEGTIDLNYAKIGGDLDCRGAFLHGGSHMFLDVIKSRLNCEIDPTRLGMRTQNLMVDGNLIMTESVLGDTKGAPFQAQGILTFHGSKINGRLMLQFAGPNQASHIEVTQATVGSLEIEAEQVPDQSSFYMEDFRFDSLTLPGQKGDEEQSRLAKGWKRFKWVCTPSLEWRWQLPCFLLGLLVGGFFGWLLFQDAWGWTALIGLVTACLFSRNTATPKHLRQCPEVKLLERVPDTHYSGRTYRRVEAWLRDVARDDHADDVYLRQQKEEIKKASFFSKLRRSFIFYLSSYGIHPGRMVWAVLLLYAFEVAMFWDQASVALVQPQIWDSTIPWFMALKTSFPILDLFAWQELKPAHKIWHCFPFPGSGWSIYFDVFASILQIVNLFLFSMLVLAISGWFKRRTED